MNTRAQIILQVLECVTGLGVLAFLFGFVLAFADPAPPGVMRNICLPLGDPGGVVTSLDGDVFVASQFYSRIQVYDSQGRFQYGFFVGSHGSPMRLEIDNVGVLTVLPRQSRWILHYDRNGALLNKLPKKKFFQKRWREAGNPFLDSHGCRYFIASKLWNPRVIREEPTGRRRTLIQTPLLLLPFEGPLPCWALAVCSGLLHFLVRKCINRRQQLAVVPEDEPEGAQPGMSRA